VLELGSPYVDEARNKIVEGFLDSTEEDYLLMLDADIEFEKDAISKTMFVAENFGADVVWGNYSLGTFANSIFGKDPESDFGIELGALEPNKIYHDVYAGGTGWCLMHRNVLLAMKEKYPGPWHWFDRDYVTDPAGKVVKFGEDMSFGRRIYQMGGKQLGFTGIILIHHKLHATVPQMMQEVVNKEMGVKVIKMTKDSVEELTK
jgi:hypothetical protein